LKKKIQITVNGNHFDIELEAKFANFLELQLQKDFNIETNNDHKRVLHAYVAKCHELYEMELKLQHLLKKIEN